MSTEISTLIEQYLQSIHRLVSKVGTQSARGDILQLVEQCVADSQQDEATQSFFLAEQAFYQQHYQEALKRYLALEHVPLHMFFCYRASAFLAATLGQTERAVEYAKRALNLQHHDLETLHLCQQLATQSGAEKPPSAAPITGDGSTLAGIFQDDMQEDQPLRDNSAQSALALLPSGRHFEHPTATLEERVAQIQEAHRELLNDYRARMQQGHQFDVDQALLVLAGCDSHPEEAWSVDTATTTEGGYYIRWNGLGMLINPGKQVLKHMHQYGLHMGSVDVVIVTSGRPEDMVGVRALGAFYRKLKALDDNTRPLHFYVPETLYQALAQELKGAAVHALALPPESDATAAIPLSDWITLHYFSNGRDLGIRLALERCGVAPEEDNKVVQVAVITGSLGNAALAHRLVGCELIIAEMDDQQLFLALDQLSPKLCLACHLATARGDLRLDVVREIRRSFRDQCTTVILPVDRGLCVDLDCLNVRCSITGAFAPYHEVRVVRSADPFGALQYVSGQCLL